MKHETFAALQAELDRVEAARSRAFFRGAVLGSTLTCLLFIALSLV